MISVNNRLLTLPRLPLMVRGMPAAPLFLRNPSLPMLLEQEVERLILSGDIAPGSRINEKEFALRFGTSRGPMREALRALEASGLVEQVRNRGTFVRRLDWEEAANVYDVRAALFGLAGRLLATRATDAQLSELFRIVEDLEAAALAGDTEEYLSLNFLLHEKIVAFAGNPVLASDYLSLVKQLRLCRARNLSTQAALVSSNKEHRAMVAAIAARDPDAAERLHAEHVALAKQRLHDALFHDRQSQESQSQESREYDA